MSDQAAAMAKQAPGFVKALVETPAGPVAFTNVRLFDADNLRFLTPGELLHKVPEHAVFKQFWAEARADTFNPPDKVKALRVGKTV